MARPLLFDASFKMFSSSFLLDFSETHHMQLSIKSANEVEGTELQCLVKLPSAKFIEAKLLAPQSILYLVELYKIGKSLMNCPSKSFQLSYK